MENKKQQNFLIGAIVGGVIAVTAALLITPASGTRLRQRMRNSISRLQKKRQPRKRTAAHGRRTTHAHILANGARKHKRAHAAR